MTTILGPSRKRPPLADIVIHVPPGATERLLLPGGHFDAWPPRKIIEPGYLRRVPPRVVNGGGYERHSKQRV